MTGHRILVTTPGSVPRSPDLARLLGTAGAAGPEAVERALAAATAAAVAWQLSHGVDVVGDGDVGRLSVPGGHGLGGFHGPPAAFRLADLAAAGEENWAAARPPSRAATAAPSNTAKITYDPAPAAARITRFKTVLDQLAGGRPAGAFLAVPSPGAVTLAGSSYYSSYEDFLAAAAGALAAEYRAIAGAGLTVQVDAPDLTLPYHSCLVGMPVEEFRARAQLQAEALNQALAGISRQQVRLHVCWGNYPGPHHRDIPLAQIIDILLSIHAGTLVLAGASPQHRADWRVFAGRKLPGDMMLAAGVIDTATPGVEAPAAVADALVQAAGAIGAGRLMAATDCGFAPFAGAPALPAAVAELKLQALRAGADLASRRLWRSSSRPAAA
jgi:5-methyltetrahydropteroyltriglutamate--homocysteine methyltransferase